MWRRIISVLGRAKRIITVLGRAKSRNVFGRTKSQPTHYESQWSQHAFFGSRKFAINLFGCAKSQHIWFRLLKIAQFFWSHKVSTYPFWVAIFATYFLWVAQSRNTSVWGRAKSLHICFGSRKVAQIFRSRKVTTYPFWVAMAAKYLFLVAQSRIISVLGRAMSRNFSVAQSHNIPILSRNGRKTPFLGRAKSH